jgi:rubrerythrin
MTKSDQTSSDEFQRQLDADPERVRRLAELYAQAAKRRAEHHREQAELLDELRAVGEAVE